MSLAFIQAQNSFALYSDKGQKAFTAFASGFAGKYTELSSPVELVVPNFSEFVDKIKQGTDLPVVLGSANENSLAVSIETQFAQTVELSGIISINSLANDLIIIRNRHGTFEIRKEITDFGVIESCVLIRLRDFQKDCLYFCGHSMDSLLIGVTGFLSVLGGPFLSTFYSDDTFLIRGIVPVVKTPITKTCDSISEAPVQIISVITLPSLDTDIGSS